MFEPLNMTVSSRQKKRLNEAIDLYTKIVMAIAKQKKIIIDMSQRVPDKEYETALIDLGLFDPSSKLEDLSLFLKKEHEDSFLNCLGFAIKHPGLARLHLDKFSRSKRNILQQEIMTLDKPTVVDLFCGAGGLSIGFVQAGYKVELANDHEQVCIDTYRYNHPDIPDERIIEGDIRSISDQLQQLVDKRIDVVVGGPPCQGFSSANQQRIIDDPRNALYKYFLEVVAELKPKFVLMENVRGMMPYANQVVEDFGRLASSEEQSNHGYSVQYKLLNSESFGVAQKRERLIFIAIRKDISDLKKVSPATIFENIQTLCKGKSRYVLADALEYIKELKAPRVKNMTEVDDEYTGSKVEINKYSGVDNNYLKQINEGRKIGLVYNHKARYVNDINYQIYKILAQGEDSTSKTIEHLMPYAHRNHLFKDKYFKLIADKPSRTITAHLRMDCHSHIHPFQIRSITPREAARIQSFPDDYVFWGAYLKTYMQIGNAVPPVMAKEIAKEIRKYL